MRRLGVAGLVVGLCGAGLPAVACGNKFRGDGDDATTSGGTSGDGAGGAAGANETGGSSTSGGTAQGGNDRGGANQGGTTATGGTATGGTATGGTSTGGTSTGGAAMGGAATGGAATGGAATGGAAMGGAATGGAAMGGAATGGAAMGGAAMGGATSGGKAGTASGGAGAGGGGGLGGVGNEPVSTDHLVYWFSADVGVVQSGNVVSRWSDRSPNGSHAAQLANATRPVLATLGRTPLPAILFDGVDDYLGLPPLTTSFTQGVTFFAVARAVTDPGCMSMMQLSNGSEIDDVSFDWHEGALQYEVFQEHLIGQDDAFGVGESRLLGVTEAADGNVALWVNGLSTGVGQFELPREVVRNQTFIGRTLYAGCFTFGGEIAEILLYARALPEDERRTVEAYLQNKWLCCGS